VDPLVERILSLAAEAVSAERIRRAPTEPPIRLLIVDAERILRLGLASLLRTARSCQVVGESSSAEQAVELARTLRPDVVIMDADLPGGSGIDACQRIRLALAGVQVLMLASGAQPQTVVAAMHAGASGYVLKRTEPARIIDAVEIVAAGGVYFEPAVATAVLDWMRQGQPAGGAMARLSEQERKILQLIAAGKTNRDIATALELSQHTVKTYVSSALKKLGLASRAEAAAFIVRRASESES
jgi:DNA-binding NarL/FixJ family response regulator